MPRITREAIKSYIEAQARSQAAEAADVSQESCSNQPPCDKAAGPAADSTGRPSDAAMPSNHPPAAGAPPATSVPAAHFPEDVPYWLPGFTDIEAWPAELRNVVIEMLQLTYRELVLDAKSGLARSSGLTMVHLTWLEILDHLEISQQKSDNHTPLDPANLLRPVSRAETIDRHLRLVNAKFKVSDLLLRLEQLKFRWRAERDSRIGRQHRDPSAPTMFPKRMWKK